MFGNIIGAGAPLRYTATVMSTAARLRMDEARHRCEADAEETQILLGDLDTQRRQAAEQLAKLQGLYRLAGLPHPGPAAGSDAARQPRITFDADVLPALPSASIWMTAGALAGACVGALAGGFAGAGPAVWNVAIIVAAMAGILAGGALQGARALAVAQRHEAIALDWQERAARHSQVLVRIRRGAVLSMRIAAGLERSLRAQERQLFAIAPDTMHATTMLKGMLNPPL
jgi:hypothetical protein